MNDHQEEYRIVEPNRKLEEAVLSVFRSNGRYPITIEGVLTRLPAEIINATTYEQLWQTVWRLIGHHRLHLRSDRLLELDEE